MSRGIARLGDRTIGTCTCHANSITVEGSIITVSPDTFANQRGVARLGDTVLADCGHTGIIITASPDTIANQRGIARLGDKTDGCYKATIITASEDTFAD